MHSFDSRSLWSFGLVRLSLALGSTQFYAAAYANDGQLDATFANGGRTTVAVTSGYNSAQSIAEMSDGRLVVAGDCQSSPCLTRLNPNGTLDTTYGPLHTGTASFSQFSGPLDHTVEQDMILLADGRAVLAGCGDSSTVEGPPTLFVVRADGSGLDTSLGNGNGYFVGTQGAATADGCAMRIRQQKDGKFVVLQMLLMACTAITSWLLG